MLRIATCHICNKAFSTSRSHSKTCDSTCRNAAWRLSKVKTVSVKLNLAVAHYRALRNQADTHGKSINEYITDRVVQSKYSQC
jgi:hypothetical protein